MFLSNEGLYPILIAPEAHDIISGQDMIKKVEKFEKLLESHIVVVIVTDGLKGSGGEDEVKFLFNNKLQNIIVSFISQDEYIPMSWIRFGVLLPKSMQHSRNLPRRRNL